MSSHRDRYLAAKLCLIAVLWLAIYVTGSAVNRRLADFPDGLALPPASAADLPPVVPASGGTVGLPAVSGAVTGFAGVSPASPPAGPSDPDHMSRLAAEALFRLTATRALAGDFGRLRPWQERAYRRGLRSSHADLVRLTTYGPWDPQHYRGSTWSAAANELPQDTVIFVPIPAHLRAISTTGARSNDRRARADGCEYWVDLWTPYVGWRGLHNTIYRRAIVVIPRG